jgi:hypothetical protein
MSILTFKYWCITKHLKQKVFLYKLFCDILFDNTLNENPRGLHVLPVTRNFRLIIHHSPAITKHKCYPYYCYSNMSECKYSKILERGAVATWLRSFPLNPCIMGSNLTRVTTMFLHMTPVLVGSRKRTRQ